MQFNCSHCEKILNLPDAKLPVGRPFTFTCPHCKQKNTARIPAPGEEAGVAPQVPSPQFREDAAVTALPTSAPPRPDITYPASEPNKAAGSDQYPGSEDSFIQSMSLAVTDDRPKGLVVYDDDEVSDMLAEKLESLGYEPTVAVNLRDAAKQLKFASFDIVLIQEDYYGASLVSNHLLKSIQNMENQTRRGMMVALISPTMTTLDDLLAFSLSFNAVVNKADLGNIDRILLSVIARGKKFYSVYRDMLTEYGFD